MPGLHYRPWAHAPKSGERPPGTQVARDHSQLLLFLLLLLLLHAGLTTNQPASQPLFQPARQTASLAWSHSASQHSTAQCLLYSTIQYTTIQYSTVQNSKYMAVQYIKNYNTVQYSTVQYNTIQYRDSTVQYSTVQYSTVQYSTLQYTALHYTTGTYSTIQYTIQYCAVKDCTTETIQYHTGGMLTVWPQAFTRRPGLDAKGVATTIVSVTQRVTLPTISGLPSAMVAVGPVCPAISHKANISFTQSWLAQGSSWLVPNGCRGQVHIPSPQTRRIAFHDSSVRIKGRYLRTTTYYLIPACY